MKILLLCHTIGPNVGSEPGTAWNLAWQLSAAHEVWVIAHPERRDSIDPYLAQNPRSNLHIVYLEVDQKWHRWDPKRGERGLKWAYYLWQHKAAKLARELIDGHGIQIVHHVTLGTINGPPVLHKLPVPVVWGPLGGGQTAPMAFKDYFPGHVMSERMRHLIAWALPFTPALRRMAHKSAMALAKNNETLELLRRAGSRRCQFLLDCGLPPEYVAAEAPARPRMDGKIELLWAGRLEQRKAPRLAIEALARAPEVPATVTFVGDGPLKDELHDVARSLGQELRVRILGKVPYTQMKDLFAQSHALLFTSLRDSSGCVVLEAMACGLPVVILNHQGVACFVTDDCGIQVPVTTPAKTIEALANAYRTLWKNEAKCASMAAAGIEAARKETWDQRARLIAGWYEQILRGASTDQPKSRCG